MADSRQDQCFFCGATFPRRELLRGAGGAICRACVAALQDLLDAAPATTAGPLATEQATRAVSIEGVRLQGLGRLSGGPPTAGGPGPGDAHTSGLGDATALVDTLEGADDADIDLDRAVSRELSAHDYESRIDLAAAYVEMGRRHAAVRELLSALESTLLCKDFPSALRCVSRARAAVDVPKVRDRICEILARHAKEE